jgi:hypothetical protein
MATAADLKTQLIDSFNNVLTAITSINNMKENLANGKKSYEIFVVSSQNGGKDKIVINDNGNSSDDEQFTIQMVASSQQVEFTKELIYKAVLTSGEFGTLETAFTSKLEGYRSDIYDNSITAIDTIEQDMVSRL